MNELDLRDAVIKLAHEEPELRAVLVPLLRKEAFFWWLGNRAKKKIEEIEKTYLKENPTEKALPKPFQGWWQEQKKEPSEKEINRALNDKRLKDKLDRIQAERARKEKTKPEPEEPKEQKGHPALWKRIRSSEEEE